MNKQGILCLDLGTQLGWALRERNGNTLSGSISLKIKNYEGAGMRYVRFTRWLNEITGIDRGENLADLIFFEQVNSHKGSVAAHVYGGLHSHLAVFGDQNGIPYSGKSVTAIKRFAAGRGNASKGDVFNAIVRRGHRPADDNEADALALLYLVLAEEFGEDSDACAQA